MTIEDHTCSRTPFGLRDRSLCMSSNFYRLSSSFWSKAAVALATLFAVLVAPLANVLPAYAATGINRQIAYQAKLLDTSGSPVADGTYQVRLSIYDAATAGTRLWTANGTTVTPTALNVSVVNGLFTVYLGDTSVAGGSQNSLDDTVLWNSDNLYLGVTIGVDAEMTPRKRLSASPYAFNAERLQGMYASSSAFGTSSVFTLNQTSNTSATGTRSTLEVRSQGTSNQNDFLIRGINDTNTPVFTINRQGNVTTTGNVVVSGDLTATNASLTTLLVGGQLPCLANGTNCLPGGSSSTPTLQQVLNQGNTATTTMQFGGGTSTGNFVTTNLNVTGTATTTNLIATNGTSTNFFATTASSTNLNALNLTAANVNVLGGTAILSSATSTQLIFTNATGSVLSLTTLTATNGTITNVTSTNLVATNGALTGVTWTNATGTNSTSTNFFATNLTGTSASFTNLLVSGKLACLADGTNCAAASLPSSFTLSPTLSQLSSTVLGQFAGQIITRGDYAYVLNPGSSAFQTYDISNPASPQLVNSGLGLSARNMDVVGDMVALGRDYNASLTLIDMSNPRNPVRFNAGNFTNSPNGNNRVVVQGNFAYISGAGLLESVDISDPTNPTAVASTTLSGGAALGFDTDGRYLYYTNDSVFGIVDIRNPKAMSQVYTTTTNSPDWDYDLEVQGGYAYIPQAGTTTVRILNVASSTNPTYVTDINLGATNIIPEEYPLEVSGKYLYIGHANGINVYNIANPATPTFVTSTALAGAHALSLDGNVLAAVATGNTLRMFSVGGIDTGSLLADSAKFGDVNIRDRASIGSDLAVRGSVTIGEGGLLTQGAINVGGVNVTSSFHGSVNVSQSLTVGGTLVCLSDGTNCTAGAASSLQAVTNAGNVTTNTIQFAGGTSTGNFATTNLNVTGTATTTRLISTNTTSTNFFATTASSTNLTALNLTTNNVTVLGGIGNFSTVTSTNLYAINSTGTYQALTDFTNTNASSIYSIPDAGSNVASTIAVDKNRLFVGKGNTGLFYFEINNPDEPVFLGSTAYTVTFRDLFVSANYLYAATAEALQIYDLNTQGNIPSEISGSAGNVGSNNYGIFVRGDYAYIAASTTGMKIVDVSNKRSPRLISTTSVLGAANKITVSGNYAYVSVFDTPGNNGVQIFDIRNPYAPVAMASNQAWDASNEIAIHEHYILLAAGTDGLVILNTVNPSSASFVSQVNTPGSAVGVTVSGRYAYVSDSTGGLTIIDLSLLGTVAPVLTTIATIPATTNVRDAVVAGQYVYFLDAALKSYKLPSARMTGADIASLQASNVLITHDIHVGGGLSLQGGLNAGARSAFGDGLAIHASNTGFAAATIKNTAPTSSDVAWGAYINTLLVGVTSTATGTANYVSVFNYNGNSQSGLCLDNLDTAANCLTTAGVSIRADDAINGTAFDLAEWYRITGSATATDLLIVDNTTSTKLKVSDGTPYDPRLIGIASTKPGFLLGDNGDIQLALAGRVPTKFSAINGSVAPGDFLTSSPFPGYAMKATKPGMIVGYALEASSGTSTIEVFVKPGYSAGTVLSVVGNESTVKDNLVFVATSTADAANQAVDSFGLTFRGSAWNASSSSAISSDFNFFNHVINATNSRLTLTNSSGTNLFTIAQNGDLSVTGRFFPAARSGAQDKTYLFVDDTMGPTSTYMATNADGWQTNDTYDFAERYYSPEPLEAGEVVTLSQTGQFHVQRAASSTEMTMGIVSTRPGFVTGRPASSTYPIALAGRVPTKVSSMNGAIHIGDPLGPSTIPGVAVKVTQQGPMIGYAMEEYNDAAVGLIEVFVEGGWYGKRVAEAPVAPSIINNNTTIINQVSTSHKGFAKIVAGAKKVTVTFATLNAFPNVQVQPRGQVIGGYYTDDYTDTSFTINMNEVQTRDVTFSWLVTATTEGDQVFLSDGTTAPVNTMTGQTVEQEAQPVVEEPVSEPTPSVEPTSSSTQETISSVDMPMSTSTEVTTSTQE